MFLKSLTFNKKSTTNKLVFILGILLIISSGISDILFSNDNNHTGKTQKKVLTGNKKRQEIIKPTKQQLTQLKNNNYFTNDKAQNHSKTATTENKLPLLARIIHAEAGGESLRGQVAVGAVLLNRIRSGKFPKALAANIFRPGEFESVSNGYIWSNPTSASYQAARLALQGWDPTYGALYFFNPAKSTSRWIWSRPINIVIGRHNFAS